MNPLLSRITIKPEQCHGRPCIRGLRICVSDVLGMLAGGMSEAEILADYRYLEADDIRACFAYAAQALDHWVVTGAGVGLRPTLTSVTSALAPSLPSSITATLSPSSTIKMRE